MSNRFIRPIIVAVLCSVNVYTHAAEGEAAEPPGRVTRSLSAIRNMFGSQKTEAPAPAATQPTSAAKTAKVQSAKPMAKVKLSTTAAKAKSTKSTKSSASSSKTKASSTAKKPVVKAVPYDPKAKEKAPPASDNKTTSTTAENRSSAKPGTPTVSETAEAKSPTETAESKQSKTEPIPLTTATELSTPPPVPPAPDGSKVELVGPPFIKETKNEFTPATPSEKDVAKPAATKQPAATLASQQKKEDPPATTATSAEKTPLATAEPSPKGAAAPSVSATPPPASKSLDNQFGLNAEKTKSTPVQQGGMTNVTTSNAANLEEETALAKADDPDSGAATPLPTFDGKWEIKKHSGHDFVSAQSIQRFYGFSKLSESGSKFTLKSSTMFISGRIGESSIQINNVKFVLSYPVTDIGGRAFFSRLDLAKLLHPVLRPSYITKGPAFDTVVIDAGHGGHDSGARGVYGYEKDYTLQLAKALAATLKRNGIKVILTRDTDVFISRPGRVDIANNIPNSIFVSLHFNSGSAAASGLETYALTPAGSSSTDMGQKAWDAAAFRGNNQDSANIALATAVHAYTLHILNKDGGLAAGPSRKKHYFIDRGVKRARWTVLTGCNRPGILFEGGFVTHGTEGQFIAFPAFRQAMANAIAQGIINYRAALSAGAGIGKRNR